jgi:excisionase family DNA binding protein
MQSDLLTPAEAASLLRWTVSTIYSAASRRKLPSIKVGRSLRFRRSDLEKIIKAGLRPALRPLRQLEDPDEGENGGDA